MNITFFTRLLLLAGLSLLLGTAPRAVHAQATYKASGPQNTITVYGTSTMHDWNMTAHNFTGEGKFDVSAANQLTGLTGLIITVPVHNLKSEHEGMNDNAYDVLKADKFKEVTFRSTSAKITAQAGNKYQIVASGTMTISGNSRPVTLTANAVLNANGSIGCSGTVPIKFSDFGIDRPSFMLGTLKCGDALTLNYSATFTK